MNAADLAQAYLAVGRVENYPPGTCVAWMDSADRVCGKPAEDYACPRHRKVALARLERDVEREKRQREAARERVAHVDLDELRAEHARLIERRDRAAGLRRHDTDDLAAYCGIGVRQTARQRRRYAAATDRALEEYTRLDAKAKALEGRINQVVRARRDNT